MWCVKLDWSTRKAWGEREKTNKTHLACCFLNLYIGKVFQRNKVNYKSISFSLLPIYQPIVCYWSQFYIIWNHYGMLVISWIASFATLDIRIMLIIYVTTWIRHPPYCATLLNLGEYLSTTYRIVTGIIKEMGRRSIHWKKRGSSNITTATFCRNEISSNELPYTLYLLK